MSNFENNFIEWIKKRASESLDSKVKGIGDDCALIDRGDFFELIENDVLTEGNHFSGKWYSPEEIGKKAVESNVSDIASMGGRPQYLFVGLVLPKDIDESYIRAIYNGLFSACSKYGISLLGGDTTSGSNLSISITLIGSSEKKKTVLRSGAKPGDLIFSTGSLGASTAGLFALRKIEAEGLSLKEFLDRYDSNDRGAFEYCLNKHFAPKAQLEKGVLLASLGVTSMIDVSDGYASEVRHIAKESCVSTLTHESNIPIDARVKRVASILTVDPLHLALSGGEDFELLFTCSPKEVKKIADAFENAGFEPPIECGKCGPLGTIDGATHDEFSNVIVDKNGDFRELTGGYNHFT